MGGGLNQGSITTWTVLAAVFTEWMFPFALPTKGTASTPRIYCSKQFQVCTHPGSFNPAHLKSISWSGATCRNIGFLQQKVADLEWEAPFTRSTENANRYVPDGHRKGWWRWGEAYTCFLARIHLPIQLYPTLIHHFTFFGTDFHVHRQRLICISSESPPAPPPRSLLWFS